jgi:hypothetical protein
LRAPPEAPQRRQRVRVIPVGAPPKLKHVLQCPAGIAAAGRVWLTPPNGGPAGQSGTAIAICSIRNVGRE